MILFDEFRNFCETTGKENKHYKQESPQQSAFLAELNFGKLINAALSLIRGIGFIFAPAKLWAAFKVTLDNTTTFPVRILGAAYLATVLMNWAAKNSTDIIEI